MCKMCEAETAPRFKDYDLDLTYSGKTELYLSSGETVEQAAFLSGYKLASRVILSKLEDQGFLTAYSYALEAGEEVGTQLIAEGSSVTLVPHVKSWLELMIESAMALKATEEPPATPEEEETFPADKEYDYSDENSLYYGEDETCGIAGCEYCY